MVNRELFRIFILVRINDLKKKKLEICILKKKKRITYTMTSIEQIQSEYPLHWAVWNDDHKELQDLIKTNKVSADFYFCI